MRATVANLDTVSLTRLRRLRNKVCAHVDWKGPITQLIVDLDAVEDKFLEPLYGYAFEAYLEACNATYSRRFC